MTAAEILNELPKLTGDELRAVRRKLIELAVEDADVAACDAAALATFQELDRQEAEHARRKAGDI